MNNSELKIEVSGGRVIAAKVMSDGSCVLTLEQATAEDTTRHHQEDIFKLVRASELSVRDNFLKYEPKTYAERVFMEEVKKVIRAGVQDFYRPTIDPSFDSHGQICYQAGMKPARGKSYNWWYEHAKKYCPERKSRLGTNSEYIAFLAVFIKEMVASGKSLEWAWNAVCNDSKELGHYCNSVDAKNDFEATGNREVCGWRDLANIYKILAEDEEAGGFWLAGGNFVNGSYADPLAGLCRCDGRNGDCFSGTGWLVLS